MGGLCQVPKIMYTISYAFNITLLVVIIVKDYSQTKTPWV